MLLCASTHVVIKEISNVCNRRKGSAEEVFHKSCALSRSYGCCLDGRTANLLYHALKKK